MLKKTITIIFFFFLTCIATYFYFEYKIPDGVTPMSDDTENIAIISLLTAIVSLFTSLVGLIQKIIEKK